MTVGQLSNFCQAFDKAKIRERNQGSLAAALGIRLEIFPILLKMKKSWPFDEFFAKTSDVDFPDELRPHFKSLESAQKILIGVSGGPDSLALMHLAAEWRCARPETHLPGPRLFIATVDHDLRPGSGLEAQQVSIWARAIGLPHQILVWEGEKPRTRIQERARAARYGLLLAHAEALQADMLLTAHHADDQAETILFRLLRGSGVSGLKGMEACVKRGALRHCRPLLGLTKADLIEVCQSRAQPFFTDPSNQNPIFARARLRGLAQDFARVGLDREALLRLGRRVARAEKALAERAEHICSRLIAERKSDFFQADIQDLRQEPEEILLRVLDCEISRVKLDPHPLRLERLESLVVKLRNALIAEAPFAATLGGTKLKLEACSKTRKPASILTIRREERR
jgi:tRNA(Ile)-lysidine synthase